MTPTDLAITNGTADSSGPEASVTEDPRGSEDRHKWLGDLALALLLFALAAIPRLAGLDVFLSPDETRWTCRSTNFYASLATGELASTYQKEHPGAITMWLGNLGRTVDPTDDVATACRDIPASKLVTQTSHETLDDIADRLFSGRIRVALFTALGIAGVFLIGVRLFGRPTSFLGALLIAWDPLFLAQSRVLHLDAVTTTLITLSLLALLVYVLRRASIWWLVAAGVMGGLAALNKSPAMFLAPFVLLVALASGWRGERGWRWIVRVIVVWGASAAITYFVVWPAMWVAPLQSVTDVFRGALGYAEDPHEGSNYFWGAIRPDPGPFFYPVAWLFRTTPLVLLGAVVSVFRLARRKCDPVERGALLSFFVFAVLFTVFMTTGAKKFDRYLLPVYPAMILFASAGLAAIVRWGASAVGKRWDPAHATRWAWPVALVVIGLLQAATVVRHHPYHLSYYNPLLGGSRAATWALLVGWGEGLEQAVNHMNARADASELTVATRYRSAVGPILDGRALEMDDFDPASLDYYLLYLNQVQRDLDPDLIDRLYGIAEPEIVSSFQGIDYAWLYPNRNYVPVLQRIDARAQEGDAIAVRSDSQLVKHYDGPLPLVTFDPDGTVHQILTVLEHGLTNHERLWYVRYDDIHPRPGLAAADFALATRVFALHESEFPELSLRLLATDGSPDLTEPDAVEAQALNAAYGHEMLLSAFGLTSAPIEWGRDLGVHLDWRAVGDIDRDLTSFIHLIGADGERWAQLDQRITNSDLIPTSQWERDASARAAYHLGVPAGTPLGPYELHIGVYDSDTGERLPVSVDGARAADDVVRIDVDVAPSPYAPAMEDLELTESVEDGFSQVGLLGYRLREPAVAGHDAVMGLYWRAEEPLDAPVGLRLSVVDTSGDVVAEHQVPATRWDGTGLVTTGHTVPIDGRALAGDGSLVVTLTDEDGAEMADPGNPVELPFTISGPARTFEMPDSTGVDVGADLGGLVALAGYELAADHYGPGDTVPLTLTWRAEQLMDVPYTVFVHMLDANGALLTQVDAQPLGGARATTSWLPGEVLLDPYVLAIPADAPSGTYRLAVGMYDPATVTPLVATDHDGVRLSDDRVMLGSVEVR